MLRIGSKIIALLCLILASVLLLSSCDLFRDASKDMTDGIIRIEESGSESESSVVPPETESGPADPYANVNIKFTCAGDDLIHPNIYTEAQARSYAAGGSGFDFKPMFSDVQGIISSADFAFINQETLMCGEGFELSGYPCFNSPQDLGRDLVSLGFDIINIANNHMLDQSNAGIEATINFWNSMPVTMIGAYLNAEDAANIRTVEKDGVKIALLSYTYDTNGIRLWGDTEIDIPYIEDGRILSEVAKAKEISDMVFVSIHWGDENSSSASDEQKRLARLMTDAGVDVIIGHHSHTLLPIEWLERTDKSGRTLCIYSLGNLVSSMMYSENMLGGFLDFTVKSDGNGKLIVDDVLFNPTVFFYGMDFNSTHIWLLKDFTDDMAASHGVNMYGNLPSPSYLRSYLNKEIDDMFLPEEYKSTSSD